MASIVTRKGEVVQDPPFVHKFLSDPRAGWLFLPLRVWLGYQWITASLHKLGSPDWMVTGNALKGFWAGASWGPLYGAVNAFRRTALGLYETATFPFQGPSRFDPVLEPEFPLGDD